MIGSGRALAKSSHCNFLECLRRLCRKLEPLSACDIQSHSSIVSDVYDFTFESCIPEIRTITWGKNLPHQMQALGAGEL